MITFETVTQVLTTLLGFAIFYHYASKLLWGPLQETIDARRNAIRAEYSRLDALQDEITAMKADYEKRIADIEAESRQRINDGVAEGRQLAEQMVEQAKREAETTLEKGRQTIAIDIDKARAELKETVINLTLGATEKIIRQKLDAKAHKEQVGKFIDELAKR